MRRGLAGRTPPPSTVHPVGHIRGTRHRSATTNDDNQPAPHGTLTSDARRKPEAAKPTGTPSGGESLRVPSVRVSHAVGSRYSGRVHSGGRPCVTVGEVLAPVERVEFPESPHVPAGRGFQIRHAHLNIRSPQREAFLADPTGREDREAPATLPSTDAHRSGNRGTKCVGLADRPGLRAQRGRGVEVIETHTGEDPTILQVNRRSRCSSPMIHLTDSRIHEMLVQVHPASLNAWSASEANAGRSKLNRNLKRGTSRPKKVRGRC
ncbi:hypothetical protein SAMN04487904_104317 [Actinopolyspora lacussalsi subsp. righensis]|uniref:Uncharacterized protein n=1 Tax=Actinopolyspora righensis TaxID=995060 RepID=A0A1I6ZG06_9ACTN|nr:hypothetical protein SAMN04487904_104317 [Actinopolyspora righensis]